MLGLSYYRLEQVDYDGLVQYSEPRSFSQGSIGEILLYPNPANDEIHLRGVQNFESIVLLDMLGKKVSSNVEVLKLSADHCLLKIQDLTTGVYLISVDGKIKKFNKQ